MRVQERGRKLYTDLFILLVLDGQSEARVGVTVSSKVGGSVVRNRVKRWIRESLRRRKESLPPSGWTVLVAKSATASAAHTDVDRDVARALERAARSR